MKLMSLFAFLAAIALLSLSGCTKQGNDTIPANASDNVSQHAILKGVSLSPRSFQAADFTDFFSKVKQAGQIVSWSGDWNELGKQGTGPAVVSELANTYGYTPLVEAQFFTQKDGKLLRPLDAANRAEYKSEAAEFAKKYTPEYMGFGIEVNTLYEKSPAEFEEFASFYGEVCDAVKAQSPNTKVFTVFQLERMKGLNGGLFGGENDGNKSEWQLLDKFPKSDIVAFTTYPGLIYKGPSDIPSDYYSEISKHTNKPVAFTEIGWHSAPSPQGWESSDAEQAAFVSVFFNRARGLGEKFAIWSFLYDQNVEEPFGSMGLIRADGSEKPALAAWSAAE